MTPACVDALIEQLWPEGDTASGQQLFAVVDGARDPRIWDMLIDTGLEQVCLLAGSLTPALAAAAPRLVHLSARARLTRLLFESGWSAHWFVLLRTEPYVTLQQLHHHLRTLLRVRDEAGRILLFRFYDPRVLRTYLPTCTKVEASAVFGPIAEFVCAGEDASDTITFAQTRSGASAHRFTPAFDV
jgi:hypothetical protein